MQKPLHRGMSTLIRLLKNITMLYSKSADFLYHIQSNEPYKPQYRIDENFVIKVSDFGLSEDIYARNYFRQRQQGEDGETIVKLPVKWMALESLNDGIFTEKTDVVYM